MCKRGDIYNVTLGEGMGSEQSGSRPAVIIQNDIGNTYSPTTIVATITASEDKMGKDYPMHMKINLLKPSKILCEQVMTISKQRLIEKVGELSDQEMQQLDGKIKISLGLS